MRLVTLHKVMIVASIAMSLLFALWAVWTYHHADSPPHLLVALLAVSVAAALTAYLRYFVRKHLK